MHTMPILSGDDVFALLDNTRAAPHQAESLLFTAPVCDVCCHDATQLNESLVELDRLRQEGFHVCGYVSYEAAYVLLNKDDLAAQREASNTAALLHFYAFRECASLSSVQVEAFLDHVSATNIPVAIQNLSLNMSDKDYCERISRIREYIRNGESYQVNFALKYRFEYQGNPISFYRRLRQRQRVEYGAFMNFPEFRVLSLSPELFLRKRGNLLESKPMKGTWARGSSLKEDRDILKTMRQDPKTLSENLMIVDLMRNDIGRMAKVGSISVENLFEIQTYETLHQMISTVKGEIDEKIALRDIFLNLFPCGSITGAPKFRTMQIIHELEDESRGVYTGAIGYLQPNNDFCFNVPIRTCIAYPDGTAEMGVGGGILYESDPSAEFSECVLKARFLTEINDSFQLLESMLYLSHTGHINNLHRHLARLEASAKTLHFSFDKTRLVHAIQASIRDLRDDTKVRLALRHNGGYDISLISLDHGLEGERALPRSVAIYEHLIDSNGFLLRHKTTERRLYDQTYQYFRASGAYDVLFLNHNGHVTEASRHNVFIEKDGFLLTSPVSEGLLGGIQRSIVMEKAGQGRCIERPLTPFDLLAADRIWLTNAVRGMVDVTLTEQALKTLLEYADIFKKESFTISA